MAEAWLHENASINVDVRSVADFAAKMRVELEQNFVPSLNEGITPLVTAKAPFGSGGDLGESALFRDMHDRNRESAMRLLNDVYLSLLALGQAADAIAHTYASGDAETAATTEDVYDAFTPTALPTTTTTPAGLPVTGDQRPGSGGPDPDRYAPTNPGGSVVIAPGTPGAYTIPADNENMNTCTPPIPHPTN